MKVCKKCGFENPNANVTCQSCFAVLDQTESKKTSKAFFEKLEKKEKRKRQFHYVLMILYLLITIPLWVLSIVQGPVPLGAMLLELLLILFCLLSYYLSLFHPDFLFELSHMFSISNLHAVQPSDWYYISTAISGYLFLGIGAFVTVFTFCGI